MTVYGVTGLICSGKSLLTEYLIQKKHIVIDADKIYNELLAANKNLKSQLIKTFGQKIKINKSNTIQIDKKKLGDIVFSNKSKLKKLNKITHPVVIDKINKIIKKYKNKTIFISAPLLIETGIHKICDKIIVVYADKNILIDRICKRDSVDENFSIKKLNSQLSYKNKLIYANFILINNQSIDFFIKQCNIMLKKIKGE